MSLLEKLNSDMKTAMKAKDKETLSVVRMLKSAVQNEQIHLGQELTEEDELVLLSREMKQRKDSLSEFQKAGRDDLADKVRSEIKIVGVYMPEPLSEDELRSIVQKAIQKTQSTSSKDFGKVMGAVIPQVKGKADGSQVNRIVKELLNN